MGRSVSSFPKRRAYFWRDPRLPFVEARKSDHAADCFRLHTHPTLSIGIVDGGRARLTLVRKKVPLRAGDIVVINPDVVHSCNPTSPRWSYRMFYFDAAWAAGVLRRRCGVDRVPTWNTPLRQKHVRAAFDVMAAAITSRAATSARAEMFAQAVGEIMQAARPKRLSAIATHSAKLAAVREYVDAHVDQRVTLDALARIAGQSKYAVLRGFRRAYGLTPHAYQLDRRINRARELLSRGLRSADVAYLTGFADQSHLHRCFRARVAVTPADYARVEPKRAISSKIKRAAPVNLGA